MRKFLVALLLGGILMGAVYGAAATLTITDVDDIGSVSTSITAPETITNIAYGLSSNSSIAANVQIDMSGGGEVTDTVDLQILSGSCGGTVEFTISTTGSTSTRIINLDTNGGGTGGSNVGSLGLNVSAIDCVVLTITDTTP